MMTELPDVEGTKRKNIIEMALDFTAIRIFIEGSNRHIAARLKEFFISITDIRNRDDYEARHRSFCEWFTKNVRTAEKTLKIARVQPSEQYDDILWRWLSRGF